MKKSLTPESKKKEISDKQKALVLSKQALMLERKTLGLQQRQVYDMLKDVGEMAASTSVRLVAKKLH